MLSTAILPAFLAIPRSSNRSLSSCTAFSDPDLFRPFSIASSSYTAVGDLASLTTIRMGGGPRTYPGGVSKWQWKRMQAKKSTQLLKARLCRERQLYEMRKRAELKAAISELERPWEVVECAPVLFSTSADQQIKALADRFQRPNGFDMWSERDGPRLFRSPDDLPSARFFPKGAVHSVKPYGVVPGELADGGEKGEKMMRYDDWIARGAGGMGRGRRADRALPNSYPLESERSVPIEGENGDGGGIPGSYCSDTDLVVAGSRKVEYEMDGHFRRHGGNRRSHRSDSDTTVDGSRIKGDDMPGNFGSRGGWDLRVSSRGSDSKLVGAVSRLERHKMDGSFGRRGGGGGPGSYRDSYKSHSELADNDSSMERDELASDFGRRGGNTQNQVSSESHSELAVTGSKMQRHEMADRRGRGGNRGSYRYSKPGKEEDEGGYGKREGCGGNRNAMAGGFGRRGGLGGNRNAMAGGFGRRGDRGRFRHSYGSPSELAGAVNGSSMERDELASDFRRGGRGGQGVNNRNQDSSESYLAVADLRIQRHKMVSSFDRRRRGRGGRGGLYSKVENEENKGGYSKRDGRGGNWNVMAGGFDRRGGRGRYWNSCGSHSELVGNDSSMERDELTSNFGRRGGGGRNQGSSESYSELSAAGSRMKRREMTGSFDRRRGRGSRGGYRGTNRSYSELEKEENEGSFGKHDGRGGNQNVMAGGFDRRGDRGGLRGWGARGGNRGFNRSSSVLAVTGSRMERNKIDGGFRKRVGHGGRKPYSSVSGTAIADSRKVRCEMAGGGGHNRDYSYGGRVSGQ